MFKIFVMPLLAITIITWNTTAWGAGVEGGQFGTDDCSPYTSLPFTYIDTGYGGDNCSTSEYMCNNDGQCILSCTGCSGVVVLSSVKTDLNTGCSFQTCSTDCSTTKCATTPIDVVGWQGYMQSEYVNQSNCTCSITYSCAEAKGYIANGFVSCTKNLTTGAISSCNGCVLNEPETPSCDEGQYLSGNSCTTCTAGKYCPGDNSQHSCPGDYPNSAAGSDEKTDCYSKPKTREWSGDQIECSKPSGCASVTCNTCSVNDCEYVAYSNDAGTGDGIIKSGCTSNNESCQQEVVSVTAIANHYVSGKTCPACRSYSSSYPSSDGGNITYNECYGEFSKSGIQEECSPTSDNVESYTCGSCTLEPCTYTKYASGTIKEDCTPDNCTKPVASVTCQSGYYSDSDDKICILCESGYYCNDSGREQCPEIKQGSGERGTSEPGSKSENDCYVPKSPNPLTATDDTGTYVCLYDAYYQTGTH